jgi:hypothetical protein
VSIGGAETTQGTAVSRTAVIPIRGMPGLTKTAQKELDPAIVGRNMDAGEFSVAYDVAGTIPVTPRPAAGLGMLFNSLFGDEQASPDQIAACIRIRYSGSESSAKISADTTGDTLTSEVGDYGSESGDTNFGTSGDIDLTAASTDTVGELVSTINGYDDYEAETVFGATDTDAAEIIDITQAQAKNKWVYVWFTSASSGIYKHEWQVVLDSTERSSYSVQVDNMHDNFLYDGCVVASASLSAALKALVEMDFEVLGMEESTGETAYSGDELESYGPYLFQKGDFSIGATDFSYLRNINMNFGNNPNTEGYGMGSLYRQYHEKGKFDCSGDLQIRYDSNVYALRSNVFDDSVVSMTLSFATNSNIATNIQGLLLIELPAVQLSDYQATENGDQIDASLTWRAVKTSTLYDPAVRIVMLTDDSAVYN